MGFTLLGKRGPSSAMLYMLLDMVIFHSHGHQTTGRQVSPDFIAILPGFLTPFYSVKSHHLSVSQVWGNHYLSYHMVQILVAP